MRFSLCGKSHFLQGILASETSMVSSAAMTKLLKQEKEALCIELLAISAANDQPLKDVHPNIVSLIDNFATLFENPMGLPPPRLHDHRIELVPGAAPVSVRPYRFPQFQKNEVEKICTELLAGRQIQPSTSPFSSPVILVKKKDGSKRMCVDYRSLNAVTVKDKFPIPIVDELLDELHGSVYFTKLDLRSGYHQIRMHEADVHKTAFRTHQGHYEFLVMPFGLTNAPSTFQSLMNDIFKDHLRKFVLVFFDDILIYSKSLEEHLQHLAVVFSKLEEHQLKVKMSKCTFGAKSVEYLGHVISEKGVAVDPEKIEAIKNWKKPMSLKGLRGFLGMAGYYRKYVKNFGIIAKALTNMLKKDNFVWTLEAETAFEELKAALCSTPVLALPDFTKKFDVECDASGLGIGAVLSQEGHPIAYLSKALAPKHLALSVYDKEMLAVVFAVEHWRPYLLGHPFRIITDHRTIQYFLNQRITTPAQQKWLLKLLGYDYTIVYKSGNTNIVPDALSRQGELNSLMGVSSPVFEFINDISILCHTHVETQRLMEGIEQGTITSKNFTSSNGQLLYKKRIFVPDADDWRLKIIKELHCGKGGGHSGWLRTYKRISRSFLWPGIKKQVKTFVSECLICQQVHYETISPPGLLQPNPIPAGLWTDISMDFIDGLPQSAGKTSILVVVDRLTKYAHFIALKHPYTARSVAELFVQEIFRLHGMPESIISDRDPIFLSAFWKNFFELQGSKLCMSTAYHPQTDGQTECLNRVLEQYLRCVILEEQGHWTDILPWAEWWYNTTYHSTIKMSPYQALYGIPPPQVRKYVPGSTAVHQVDLVLRNRDELLSKLKCNMEQAQARMKVYYDKHHTEREFDIGDWVFLKLQPYRQKSVQVRKSHKLSPKYFGPYQVIEKIGKVAYKLELPASARVHPVFHVSLLKKKLGSSVVPSPTLPPSFDSNKSNWVPAKVLQRALFKKGNKPEVRWLIQWKNGSEDDATWECAEEFQKRFPDFKG
ncbi:putative nucleotidyltransferase, Ribonuclease H [Rosa chinensis]|uniref:Putative nucleotidyltransferase, Ribonuclease H n=2 Tax=Rosa chinensis TaxID=74649 RepID=A0A2P6R624_ROSCH|nr:putative nucleotidyltransferase, Ribonuclease H [Rosa chinensis]